MSRPFIDANKRFLWKTAPWLFRLLAPNSPREYSIGIYTGTTPLDLTAHAHGPVLSGLDVNDVPASLTADPFLCRYNGMWYMFFELVNLLTNRGEIGYASSLDGFQWKYGAVVLTEPFHLSYPYVFEWRGDFYMIPETARAKSVRMYKAADFPRRWEFSATLLEGGRFVDNSIFEYDSKWWLFTEAGPNATSPLLRLFFADQPFGPWTEHPCSPIWDNVPDITRPAGRVVIHNGKPLRFAQTVYPEYGTQVQAVEIEELTETTYRESDALPAKLLGAGSEPWNSDGMHHVDPQLLEDGTWLACVDGAQKHR